MDQDDFESRREESGSGRRGLFGCLGVVLVLVAGITFGAVHWLKSGQSSDILSMSQLQSLQLSGTWKDADGATITFGNSVVGGDDSAQGGVTFHDVPNVFTFESGAPPTSESGAWQAGTVDGSIPGVVMIFSGSATSPNDSTMALLIAEGDPSSPTLVCDTVGSQAGCTFTKQ